MPAHSSRGESSGIDTPGSHKMVPEGTRSRQPSYHILLEIWRQQHGTFEKSHQYSKHAHPTKNISITCFPAWLVATTTFKLSLVWKKRWTSSCKPLGGDWSQLHRECDKWAYNQQKQQLMPAGTLLCQQVWQRTACHGHLGAHWCESGTMLL